MGRVDQDQYLLLEVQLYMKITVEFSSGMPPEHQNLRPQILLK